MDEAKLRFARAVGAMVEVSDSEFEAFIHRTRVEEVRKGQVLAPAGRVPDCVFFVVRGIVRVVLCDADGIQHSIHFALEDQFIADYASFIVGEPALYELVALEDTQVVVLPRTAVDWGYQHLAEGQKMGRLIAEQQYMYQDQRLRSMYTRTPKQRYDQLVDVFQGIHQRVPQHMIASYLGISSIHLSRLKRG